MSEIKDNKESILKEALIEVQDIQDILKGLGKEMLTNVFKQELSERLKEGLSDEETIETDKDVITEVGDDEEEETETEDPKDSEDTEDTETDGAGVGDETPTDLGTDETEIDAAIDLPPGDESGEITDIGSEDFEEINLQDAGDDELLTIFKKITSDDEIVVAKKDGNIHLSDKTTGDEYIIKDEAPGDVTDVAPTEDPFGDVEFSDFDTEDSSELDFEDDDEPVFEIEMNDGDVVEETEDVKMGAAPVKAESAANKNPKLHEQYIQKAKENKELKEKIVAYESEVKDLREAQAEFKTALTTFKNNLSQVLVVKENLVNVTKLFTEHTTNKKEKVSIIERFDGVKTLAESKSLYEQISNELNKTVKPTITEITEGANALSSSSSKELTESKLYQDSELERTRELMYMSRKTKN